jgi:hypothetical protein
MRPPRADRTRWTGRRRLVVAVVVLGMMGVAVAFVMAAWIGVIALGVLMPGWTPRRACEGFLAFIHEAVGHVKALDQS